jgi:GTP-binding protein EngB required for normal cell division
MSQLADRVLVLANELAEHYQLSSIKPLLDSCSAALGRDELSIAVVGRFKAGKSSFLNHLLGRSILPVGVIPVTTIVTEVIYGPTDRAVVHYIGGALEEVPLERISSYIAESQNPRNAKQVARLTVELSSLESVRALRFIDTPGLESVLVHNTQASLEWLPNAALALVAVSIETPLSQHDLDLLRILSEYTPGISLLLTKADLLDAGEQAEVVAFIREQLTHSFDDFPDIFLYSTRPGYEHFKRAVEEKVFRRTLDEFRQQRSAIVGRKLETLLRECEEYLTLALKAAETHESERMDLTNQIAEERESLEEIKREMSLVIRHAASGTRDGVAGVLESQRHDLERRLVERLKAESPKWKKLSHALKSFEEWLQRNLSDELQALSLDGRAQFFAPLEKVKTQLYRASQHFRDRLSERTFRAFGVPLSTSETEIRVEEPHSPDVYIGKVFDRNWELLSPILPMPVVRPIVERHFTKLIPDMVERNISRLATQWEESIKVSISQIGEEAARRLDDLVATLERLTTRGSDDAARIYADLEHINTLQDELRQAASSGVANEGTGSWIARS